MDCDVNIPDSKVHGANMGPTWGRQDPGGPHVGPMKLAIWEGNFEMAYIYIYNSANRFELHLSLV